MEFRSGAKAEGNWQNGKLNGLATMWYPNGDIYIGEWIDNLKCGKGTYIMCNGQQKYEGEFFNDIPHGKGTMVYENGDIYIGMFKEKLKDGFGVMSYTDLSYILIIKYFLENKYEGEFKRDERTGKGKMIYSNGDIYEGDWLNDQKRM